MKATIERFALERAAFTVLPVVPPKAHVPAHGCIAIVPGEDEVMLVATDGDLIVRCPALATGVSGETELVPAAQFAAMVRSLPNCGTVTLETKTTKSSSTATLKGGGSQFRFPLLLDKSFPEFPTGTPGDDHDLTFLEDALRRVEYAIGRSDSRPELRVVELADGKASAYSGRRMQVTPALATAAPVLVPDVAVVPLGRFLRVFLAPTTPTLGSVHAGQLEAEEVPPRDYVIVSLQTGAAFAFPTPATQFADLAGVFDLATSQEKESGQLTVSRQALLEAARAARISSDARSPRCAFDFSDGLVVLSSGKGDDSNFTMKLDATYEGGDGSHYVEVSIEDLIAMVEASDDEMIVLYFGPQAARSGNRWPLVQLIGEDGARGLISQAVD